MANQVIKTLYKVKDNLTECRKILDTQMYGNEGMDQESEEYQKLRKIYDAICRVMDMM